MTTAPDNRRKSRLNRLWHAARYRAAEYALRAFVAAIPRIPRPVLEGLTAALARVSFWVMWRYRVRMETNIVRAIGDQYARPDARRALVWQAWKNFARGLLDTATLVHRSRAEIAAAIAIEGEEHLRRALAQGKGVLALSAHLGGFTLIGARLAAAGYPFSVVVKQPRSERFAKLIDRYRAEVGIDTISARPRREAVRGILRALRQNRVVLVIADEFKSGGVAVDFFGQQASAPRGPAALALRTSAPTLPMFAVRRPDNTVVLSIGPQIEPIRLGDVEQSVAATTALFTRYLEGMIRRYPDQWNWLGFPRDGRMPRARAGEPSEPQASRPDGPRPEPGGL
ncbi:MAG TPA: lysophospholipid acyltransferase family protein [candidate division Zixibacteria bacterium]|nr:lysophospholipid acyltransferase family protein [candidate division Zixibacteria bacterium]